MSADDRAKAMAPGRVSPGEHLRAEIRRLALDQVAVGRAIGVSRQSINNIINGRQPISRAMAKKLGRLTGQNPDYWLRASFSPTADDRFPSGAPPHADRAGVLVNHQIAEAVKRGIIAIEPFEAGRIRAASVDLTLGDVVIAGDQATDRRGATGFVLRAGCGVEASTAERVTLPRDHAGRIGTLHDVGRAGIIVSHAFQIEPGFAGKLQFRLFNAGGTSFRLQAGTPVIGLEIMRLGAVPDDSPVAARRGR